MDEQNNLFQDSNTSNSSLLEINSSSNSDGSSEWICPPPPNPKPDHLRSKNNPILRILPSRIRDTLNLIPTGRFVQKNKLLDGNYRSSYRILSDLESRPLCILNLPYFDDDSLNSVELKEFLVRIGYTYIIMIIVAVVFAFFISKYITKSLKSISDKMHQTRFEKRNKKINRI